MSEVALAVDIGGTHAKLGLVTREGELAAAATEPAPRCADEYADLSAAMHRLVDEAGLRPCAIGLSIAGLYDASRRTLTYHPNNPGLEGSDFLTPLLTGFSGLPWAVERDINAGALGEYQFGVGRGTTRFLCVVLGTGVGAGVIVDGELLRFTYDGIGDPGYVIVDPEGELCPGGSRGCLESEVSAAAVARRAAARLEAFPESSLAARSDELLAGYVRPVIEAARAGDVLARKIMRDTGYLLGIGLSTLASIFAPEVIAVAGGLVEGGHDLIEAARQSFQDFTAPFYSEGVRIERAQLGAKANVIGAAVAAFSVSA